MKRLETLLERSPAAPALREIASNHGGLPPIMLVGATCRDLLHAGHGFGGELRRTDDLDIGIAVGGWEQYEQLVSGLDPVSGSSSGIRYLVTGLPVDIMPFGENVEVPDGVVAPAARRVDMSVFGFQDVWMDADELLLEGVGSVRLPTVAGYTVLKLKAWLDRAPIPNYKDAGDLACAMYWYQNDGAVEQRIFETDDGLAHFEASDYHVPVAAVRVLAEDALAVLTPERSRTLSGEWRSGPPRQVLARWLAEENLPQWPSRMEDRLALVDAVFDVMAAARS